MNFLSILKIIAAIATILTGLFSLIKPTAVFDFTGLRVEGGRGITEIRSILGAFFIGLGIFALYKQAPDTYTMLGFTYLVVGVVRTISMFVDHSIVKSNVVSAIVEFILGIILVIP